MELNPWRLQLSEYVSELTDVRKSTLALGFTRDMNSSLLGESPVFV